MLCKFERDRLRGAIGPTKTRLASGDAEIGDKLVLTTKGVFTMSKVSTDVMAVGDVVYFDESAGLVTTDDDTGTNPRIGLAVTAAGNPSGSVNVRLDG